MSDPGVNVANLEMVAPTLRRGVDASRFRFAVGSGL